MGIFFIGLCIISPTIKPIIVELLLFCKIFSIHLIFMSKYNMDLSAEKRKFYLISKMMF